MISPRPTPGKHARPRHVLPVRAPQGRHARRRTLVDRLPVPPSAVVGAAAAATLAAVGTMVPWSQVIDLGPASASADLAGPLGVAPRATGTTGYAVTVTSPMTSPMSVERQFRLSRSTSRTALANRTGAKSQESTGQAAQANAAVAELAANAEKTAAELAKNRWILPVAAGSYHLTARFGQCSGLWAHCHTGLDFAAPTGTPIMAMANGTVIETGSAGAYGNRTIITLADGTDLWFCHQNAIAVTVGQTVVPGQVIGYVGSTGNTTGPHLHLEVRPGGGDPVDPERAMAVNGATP